MDRQQHNVIPGNARERRSDTVATVTKEAADRTSSVVAVAPPTHHATALLVRRWDFLADSQESQKAGATENPGHAMRSLCGFAVTVPVPETVAVYVPWASPTGIRTTCK